MAKRCLSSGEVIAEGWKLIEEHNPEITEHYKHRMREIFGPSEKPYTVAWAVVHEDTSAGLNVVYYSLAHTRREAYDAALTYGEGRFSNKEMRKLGFKAKRVRITLEE